MTISRHSAEEPPRRQPNHYSAPGTRLFGMAEALPPIVISDLFGVHGNTRLSGRRRPRTTESPISRSRDRTAGPLAGPRTRLGRVGQRVREVHPRPAHPIHRTDPCPSDQVPVPHRRLQGRSPGARGVAMKIPDRGIEARRNLTARWPRVMTVFKTVPSGRSGNPPAPQPTWSGAGTAYRPHASHRVYGPHEVHWPRVCLEDPYLRAKRSCRM